MIGASVGNLLLNGDFELWSRLACPDEVVVCRAGRETFAADRWKVSYVSAPGGEVTQACSADIPAVAFGARSLELRGVEGLTSAVRLSQALEAAEAARYRRPLVLSLWVLATAESASPVELTIELASPEAADVFDGQWTERQREMLRVPAGRWVHLEHAFDGRILAPTGLAFSIEFPAELLGASHRVVRIARARLVDPATSAALDRPTAIETLLARRFFQRLDATRLNSIGRALVVNAHELHFQLTFSEMRAYPACTLPHDEEALRVFNLEGIPQSGFRYDVTYRSRGSAIIRATRENHGLSDGFLSFVGTQGAILLDAEL